MNAEMMRRLRQVFADALDIPAADRETFLVEACDGSVDLEREVRSLLEEFTDIAGESFLEPPPATALSEKIRADETGILGETGPFEETGRRRASALAGRVLEGRYRLGRSLGRGAFSTVFLAEDLISGEEVAVKLLECLPEGVLALVRREAAILRILRLPGVVQMIDEGVEEGIPFIVMERARGEPFGRGDGRTWEEVEPTALSLLETVSRIHWAGVIHRDLKPENVLVDPEGRPTVLDLGTATEPGARSRFLSERGLAGTPLYISPEQLGGMPATVQSDLYAVGVMLFECLAGRRPHEASSLAELLVLRLEGPPPSLAAAAPDTPERICRFVDRLLAKDPRDRPSSAAEGLAELRGTDATPDLLPRLGRDTALWLLLVAASKGRSVDLFGAPGTGRTRCLREFAEALRSEGREVLFLVPGAEPFESLAGTAGPLEDIPARTAGEAREFVDLRVREALDRGAALIADDLGLLDESTREGLKRWRRSGFVVRAVGTDAGPEDEPHLAPFEIRDLVPLFGGSDRLFHTRRDAAMELHRRTGGFAERVGREVDAWTRAGLARWERGRLLIRRTALDRLRTGLRVTPPSKRRHGATDPLPAEVQEVLACVELAGAPVAPDVIACAMDRPLWRVSTLIEELDRHGAVRVGESGTVEALAPSPLLADWPDERKLEIHQKLADALASGANGRLRQLVAAGRREEIPAEALATARSLSLSGHVGEARVAIIEGLIALRRIPDPQVETDLLRLLVELSLKEGRAAALDETLYWLARTGEFRAEVLALETITRAALLGLRGDGERALELISVVDVEDTPKIDRLRSSVAVFSSRFTPAKREEEVVLDAVNRARAAGERQSEASAAEWLGWLRYRQGDYEEAARLHEETSRLAADLPSRLSALLNAASAWMEAGCFTKSAEVALRARETATGCRHPLHEARAEWLVRAVRYRGEREQVPDRELVDAAAGLGAPNLEAMICLTEAAVAWRCEQPALAAELADRAAHVWSKMGRSPGKVLAEALALTCRARPALEEIRRVMKEATECPVPGIAVQSLGLLARADPRVAGECVKLAAEAAKGLPEAMREVRREVTSVAEALSPP